MQSLVERFVSSNPAGISALMILYIDNFKQINDSLGHLFGDAALSHIARKLKKAFPYKRHRRPAGRRRVYRFFKDIPNGAFAFKKAVQTVRMFEFLFLGGKACCTLSCSIGVSLFPDHGTISTFLYQTSDLALYKAKSIGKNCVVLYEQSLSDGHVYGLGGPRADTAIESDESNRSPSERLTDYVFQILYNSTDVETAVGMMLEMIGK